VAPLAPLAPLATLATLATNDKGLQPAEMLKTEMHKTAKVCKKALFSKNIILTLNLLIISLLFVK
jgi:hypothetical protein